MGVLWTMLVLLVMIEGLGGEVECSYHSFEMYPKVQCRLDGWPYRQLATCSSTQILKPSMFE